jgi:cell division GTPase FtsZ
MELYSKIGIIGIGNCGGQIAYLAERKHPELFDCIYINTSEADLSMVGDSRLKFKIGENELEGSGKNRKRMKRYFKQDIADILRNTEFQSIVNEKKYVFVAASTAGGTGSGAAPVFVNVLKEMFPDVNFILVAVLPQLQSSRGETENALEFLKEVYTNLASNTTYMLYDNETTSDLSSTKSLTEVNESIVEDIRVISGIDNHPTPYESIDVADMESIVATPGRLIVLRINKGLTEKTMEDTTADDLIIKALKTSKHAETNRDKNVVRYGVITYFTEEVQDLYKSDLQKVQDFLGVPQAERFNHNAINKNDESMNYLYFIASGLSPIIDRITKMNERLEKLRIALTSNKQLEDAATLAVSKMVGVERIDEKKQKSEVKINDIFSKF